MKRNQKNSEAGGNLVEIAILVTVVLTMAVPSFKSINNAVSKLAQNQQVAFSKDSSYPSGLIKKTTTIALPTTRP